MGKFRQQIPGHKPQSQSIVLVVGLVRNCAAHVQRDVQLLKSANAGMQGLHWLLVESDSTDSTLEVLAELRTTVENFAFISLGHLRTAMPQRTQRIAHCRNEYVRHIRQSSAYEAVDYVMVADFDGLNTHVTQDSIASCWQRTDWDMCAANQRGPYYDILALRHKHWSPNDCWAQFEFFRAYKPDKEENLRSSVYSRMITIPPDSAWIEVDSAFGGLAVYKRSLFDLADYAGLDEDGAEVCEHVPFHRTLAQGGARLFVNPRLINAGYTEHTKNLRPLKTLVRSSKSVLRRTLRALIGPRGA